MKTSLLRRKRLVIERKIIRDKIHEEEQIRKARNNINNFMEFCFSDPQNKQHFKQAGIHREWHKHISQTWLQKLHPGIISPRDHGKTTQIVIGRVLYELGKYPTRRIKIVSANDNLAVKRLRAIRGMIDRNKNLHKVFPKLESHPKIDLWRDTAIIINRRGEDKDPSVEASGVLSGQTGSRADLIIFDDVCEFKNTIQNPGMRSTVKDSFFEMWMNMLEETGKIIYISTLWHKDDLTHELMSMKKYQFIFHAVGDNFEPIWIEKFGRRELIAKREDTTQRAYNRGFRNIALSDEDKLFKDEWINGSIKEDARIREVIQPHWRKFTGVDLSSRKRRGVVIFTIAIDDKGTRYNVDIRRGAWSSPETARQILDVWRIHKPETIQVENNAYQTSLIEWLEDFDIHDLPVRGFTTGRNKMDEEIGLPGLAVEFERGMWCIIREGVGHGMKCRCNICNWIQELEEYPICKTNDTLMASWLAREAGRSKRFKNQNMGIINKGIKSLKRSIASKFIDNNFLDEIEEDFEKIKYIGGNRP